MKNKKICFIADGHKLYDDRMYWKEALSAKNNGFDVSIIFVADKDESGISDEGIDYYSVKKIHSSNLLFINKIWKYFNDKTNFKILQIADKLKADIYHLHDYQQHKIVKKLKKLSHNPKVIFDAREPLDLNLIDFSQNKSYLKRIYIKFYATLLQRFEYKMIQHYDYIFTVDHGLYNRFIKNSKVKNITNIYNYTNLNYERNIIPYNEKEYDAIYCGGISRLRGFYPLTNIAKEIAVFNKKLLLLGKIVDVELKFELEEFIKNNNLENHLIWIDEINYSLISEYYNKSRIGINILLPVDAFQNIMQIKLYEYMNFGLPIICSDFGKMKKIVELNKVGVTVNPYDVKKISEQLIEILNDNEKYNYYSQNGISVVDKEFNWMKMESKIIEIYNKLLC